MSARSSRRSAAFAVVAAAACGHHASKPEADPARVVPLAAELAHNSPTPGAVRDCKPGELTGGITMTEATLLRLAHEPVTPAPEHADWVNPVELDSPAARTLVDASADPTAQRQAAAELLAAPFYAVYRVDIVNAPMALGIKELKIGTLGARAIRYDRSAHPTCVVVFAIQNDKATSDLAIEKSDRPMIDGRIEQALRDDLKDQYLRNRPR